MIKLIALDLDQTLFNNEKEVSEGNKAAIRLAQEQGIRVVLCTGRPIQGVQYLLEDLNMLRDEDYVVTFNGGVVQKARTGEIIFEDTLSYEDICRIHRYGMEANLPTVFIDLDYAYVPEQPVQFPTIYPEMRKNLTYKRVRLHEVDPLNRYYKALYCLEPDILDQHILRLNPQLFTEYSCMKSLPEILEILPANGSKAKGLEALAHHLQMGMDQIMACGDEANDYEMIRSVGFGVAMGNATESVKSVADFITDSNQEDGVAKAILYMLENNRKGCEE